MTSQNLLITVWLLHCNNIVVIPAVLVLVMKTFLLHFTHTCRQHLDGDDDGVKISLYLGKESL